MRVCTLFSARLVITLALAALFHPAFGHGLGEDTFSLLMHMQSNRLPALLAGYCADAPESVSRPCGGIDGDGAVVAVVG